jgi:SAM-dependent methyltransferase
MCNQWCLEFGSKPISFLQKPARILEVGSRNVNGTVRDVLSKYASEYIGVDLFDGPGVDIVCNVTALTDTFATQSFDLVVSTEMLEHCLNWQDALCQMASVLRQDGLLLITTRSPGFELHDYPADYWRFTYGDFEKIFQPLGDTIAIQNDLSMGWPCGIGILVKKKLDQSKLSEWKAWLDTFAVYSMANEAAPSKAPIRHITKYGV